MDTPLRASTNVDRSPPEPMISVNQLADHLQITDETVRRLARSGVIPSIKAGRRLRFSLAAVLNSLENRK